jgi:hypothetical protein
MITIQYHNYQNNNQPTNKLTMSLLSLLPFICFPTLALYHFQFYPTCSSNCQSHTLLSPACIPHSLFGIVVISTTLPAHLLSAPCSLMLLIVIIWGDFIEDYFLISACMQCLLDFWCASQNSNRHTFDRTLTDAR